MRILILGLLSFLGSTSVFSQASDSSCVINSINTAFSRADLPRSELARQIPARSRSILAQALLERERFGNLAEIDAINGIGPITMRALVAWGEAQCRQVEDRPSGTPASLSEPSIEVIFSPAALDSSHLSKIKSWIDGSTASLDLALYSLRPTAVEIIPAIAAAVRRGVKVRALLEQGSRDQRREDGGISEQLEQMGVEVRYINKTMHHKFALIDVGEPGQRLLTGSANWTGSAATRYDENTVFVAGQHQLLAAFAAEFAYLWRAGRNFEFGADSASPEVGTGSSPVLSAEFSEAVFTSANFAIEQVSAGPRLTNIDSPGVVQQRLKAIIAQAENSIWVASGHLRSSVIAGALIAAKKLKPDLDIKVYLDGAEFISESYSKQQIAELTACRQAAQTVSERAACDDQGLYYSHELVKAGIDVRFKSYAYRWHYSYADQMHHKYMIVDGDSVITGSYNYSYNAEFASLENIVILTGEPASDAITDFKENFAAMWTRGRSDFQDLTEQIEGGASFPLVYDAISLTWAELGNLKELIWDNCPLVSSAEYRQQPESYRYCYRD